MRPLWIGVALLCAGCATVPATGTRLTHAFTLRVDIITVVVHAVGVEACDKIRSLIPRVVPRAESLTACGPSAPPPAVPISGAFHITSNPGAIPSFGGLAVAEVRAATREECDVARASVVRTMHRMTANATAGPCTG